MDLSIIYSCITSIAIGLLIGYPLILIMRKLKAKQEILSYVDNHKSKSGTPTIGGLIFIIPAAISAIAFAYDVEYVLIAVGIMLAYGIIGFLDDVIKIMHKENQGLKAYQKIIGQAGIAAIVSAYCYINTDIRGGLIVPFTEITLDIGWGIIPLVFLMFIAVTNAVNLIDGLDGLATSVSSVIFAVLGIMTTIMAISSFYIGDTRHGESMTGLAIFSFAIVGGLLAFICYNGFPAKIFMGDTGSLALGGAMASILAFSGQLLIVFLLGIMLIITCLSVIMQVIYFKATKGKRIWLMSPLHHHYQYKGCHENKIVIVYTVITILMGLISIISVLRGVYV